MKLLNYPLQVIILYLVWSFIYSQAEATEIASFSLETLLLYFILQKMMSITLSSADVSLSVERDITGESDTSLVIYICRPLNYSLYQLARSFAPASLQVMLSFTILLGVSLVFPPLSFITLNVRRLALFFVMMLISFVITFFIHLIIGYCTFWLGEAPRWYYYSLEALTAGALIPLNLFPLPIYQLLMLLPMAQVYYFPIAVFLDVEKLTISSLSLFLAWPIILFFIAHLMWIKGLKRFDAQGG